MKVEDYVNPYEHKYSKDKRDAFICDLDGTLSIMNGRHPYDGHLCETDVLHAPLAAVLRSLSASGYDIILLSGRMGKAREATETWLDRHNIRYDALHMRNDQDFRSDEIVKEELYTRYVKPYHNIIAVFDDRPRVIRMWERLGLMVFDCGNGEEF